MIVSILLALPSAIFSQSITVSGEQKPCPGSTQTYTLQASPLCSSYSWVVNGGTIIGSANGTSIQVKWFDVPNSPGFVQANGATCGNNASLGSNNYNVTTYAAPPAPAISGPSGVECNNTNAVTYSASTVEGATEYVWTLPSGWSGQTSGQSITVFPNATGGGTISVYAKVKCAQSTALSYGTVSRTAPNLGAISGGAGCFCAGQTQSYSVPAVNGATSYVWTASGSLFIAGGQGTTNVSVGSSGTGGNLTCYATTACGNTNTVSSNYIGTSPGAPPTPVTTILSTPCPNYQRGGTFQITNADPCATYYWSAEPGVLLSTGLDLAYVEVPGAGYGLSVYGVNACGTSSASSRPIPLDPQCSGPLRVQALNVSAAPNPFSNQTIISYTLPEEGTVQLDVVSPVRGVVASIAQGKHEAGKHEKTFDASRLPSGVYTARLTFNPKGSEKPQQTSIQLVVQR